MFFLTIENKRLALKLIRGQVGSESEVTEVIESRAQWDRIMRERGNPDVICSSAIDFPEDFTDDPAVLALVADIKRPKQTPQQLRARGVEAGAAELVVRLEQGRITVMGQGGAVLMQADDVRAGSWDRLVASLECSMLCMGGRKVV